MTRPPVLTFRESRRLFKNGHVNFLTSEMRASSPSDQRDAAVQCRFCGTPLRHTFADLGMMPLCERYVTAGQLNEMEPFYPTHARICSECFLVQLHHPVSAAEIFEEYAYFSSYSASWLRHAAAYVDMIIGRLELTARSCVVEIGSNDGYLLRNFAERGIAALGIEPARNVARVAIENGVETVMTFFSEEVAQEMAGEGRKADLLIANNVLAQVPDINDFVIAMRTLLKPGGVITLEFPHLWRLIEGTQFDTIYHEHYSYFSFTTAEKILARHHLTLFDVEELPTHGGSLRVYARHEGDETRAVTAGVTRLRDAECVARIDQMEMYTSFGERLNEWKRDLLEFLIVRKREGHTIAGYGAPGKGSILLNYCGIRADFLDYTVDLNPYKQGKFLPGTHIPVFSPERIMETKPNYLFILAWNLRDEIMQQMSYIREWGGRFIVPIPKVTLY